MIYQIYTGEYEDNRVHVTYQGPDGLESDLREAAAAFNAASSKYEKEVAVFCGLLEAEYALSHPAPAMEGSYPVKGDFEKIILNPSQFRGTSVWDAAVAQQKAYMRAVADFKAKSNKFYAEIDHKYLQEKRAYVATKIKEKLGPRPIWENYLPAELHKVPVRSIHLDDVSTIVGDED